MNLNGFPSHHPQYSFDSHLQIDINFEDPAAEEKEPTTPVSTSSSLLRRVLPSPEPSIPSIPSVKDLFKSAIDTCPELRYHPNTQAVHKALLLFAIYSDKDPCTVFEEFKTQYTAACSCYPIWRNIHEKSMDNTLKWIRKPSDCKKLILEFFAFFEKSLNIRRQAIQTTWNRLQTVWHELHTVYQPEDE
ncbi:MAG: hypothetical protein WCF19_07355 [Chlamydiales bacterium]